MLQMMLSAYVLGIILAMPPGSVTIAAGRRAIAYGFRSSVFFTMGSTLADFFYAVVVYIGLAPLLTQSEPLRLAMWGVGGAWLLWLGWEAVRSPIQIAKAEGEALPAESPRATFSAGLLITLTNPLTVVSWVAIAGNFFSRWQESYPPLQPFGLLAILMMLAGILTWFLSLMRVLSIVRHFIDPRILRGASIAAGSLLMLFGLSAWASALQVLL